MKTNLTPTPIYAVRCLVFGLLSANVLALFIFLRKICKACKCRPEFHEVHEDEDPGKLRIGRLFDSPVKGRLEQVLFSSTSDNDVALPNYGKANAGVSGEQNNSAISSPAQLPPHVSSAVKAINEKFDWIPKGITLQMVCKLNNQSIYPI